MTDRPTATPLQPDQAPSLWGAHAAAYEEAFEPLTNRFAEAALDRLAPDPGAVLLDVGAGTGGAALIAASRGARVIAIDASDAMAARAAERGTGLGIRAAVMDAGALALADGSAATILSVFGIILCPDPVAALREARRVLVPGGRIALVTWTEPHRYELATRLIAASAGLVPPRPPGGLPAQLRFVAEADFRGLFGAAGLEVLAIERREATLEAPSARWLGERLAFAPGLAALLAGFGEARAEIVDRFVRGIERDQGEGPIALDAVAFVGIGRA